MNPLILVAEDDDQTFELLRLLARMAGLNVARAVTGREVLTQARDGRPDLILLDLILADGVATQTLRALRRAPATREIPVIAMSSLHTPELVHEAESAGCQDFLAKPFRVDDFRGVVTKWAPPLSAPAPLAAPTARG